MTSNRCGGDPEIEVREVEIAEKRGWGYDIQLRETGATDEETLRSPMMSERMKELS